MTRRAGALRLTLLALLVLVVAGCQRRSKPTHMNNNMRGFARAQRR